MRSPIALQGRPPGPAPRKMRKTLYWAPVRPRDFRSCAASWPRASAVFRIATNKAFSGAEGACEFLKRGFTPENILVVTTIVKRKIPQGSGFPYRAQLDFAQETLRALRGYHGDRMSDVLRRQYFGRILGAVTGKFRGHASGANHADAYAMSAQVFRHAAG